MSFIDRHYTIPPDVLFQEMNGETVLLDLDGGEYFGLDGSGSRIWQLLSENGDARRVLDRVSEEYDVDPKVLERDLEKLLKALLDAGLVATDSPAE